MFLNANIHLYKKRRDAIRFDDKDQKYDGLEATYYGCVLWIQSQLAQMRDSELPFLVSFADCMSGDLSRKHVRNTFQVDEDEVPFARCPLYWSENQKIRFACNRPFGNWLVGSIAYHYILFDVVAGTGTYDLSAFPPELDESDSVREMLSRSVVVNASKRT